MRRNIRWTLLALVLGAVQTAPSQAMRRTFREGRETITFEGALEQINPMFMRGFISQQGADGPNGRPVTLRIWLGKYTGQTADTTITDANGQQRQVRGAHLFRWTQIQGGGNGGLLTANGFSREGRATQGFNCGFSVDFTSLPAAQKPDGKDVIWIYVSHDANRRERRGWRVMEFRFGWEESNPFVAATNEGRVDPSRGNADNFNQNLAANSGQAYYRGHITDMRRTSLRGYAFDELALYRQTYRPLSTDYTIAEFIKVKVRVSSRQYGSVGDFQQEFESPVMDANQAFGHPLEELNMNPSQIRNASTANQQNWKYGWQFNFNEGGSGSRELAEGKEYKFELMLAGNQTNSQRNTRFGASNRIGTVMDIRTMVLPPSGANRDTNNMIVEHKVTKSANDTEALTSIELDNAEVSGSDTINERLTTRAMLYPEELYRFQSSTGWVKRGEMVGTERIGTGTNPTATRFRQSSRQFMPQNSFLRMSLPGTADKDLTLNGNVEGGVNYDLTFQHWRQQEEAGVGQDQIFSRRHIFYDWTFPKSIYAAEVNNFLKDKEQKITTYRDGLPAKIDAIVTQLATRLKEKLTRETGDVQAPRELLDVVVFDDIKIKLVVKPKTDGVLVRTATSGNKVRREYVVETYLQTREWPQAEADAVQAKLDDVFNKGKIKVGFGLSPTQIAANAPETAIDQKDRALAEINFTLKGRANVVMAMTQPPETAGYEPPANRYVSVRYLYAFAKQVADPKLATLEYEVPAGGTATTTPPRPTDQQIRDLQTKVSTGATLTTQEQATLDDVKRRAEQVRSGDSSVTLTPAERALFNSWAQRNGVNQLPDAATSTTATDRTATTAAPDYETSSRLYDEVKASDGSRQLLEQNHMDRLQRENGGGRVFNNRYMFSGNAASGIVTVRMEINVYGTGGLLGSSTNTIVHQSVVDLGSFRYHVDSAGAYKVGPPPAAR